MTIPVSLPVESSLSCFLLLWELSLYSWKSPGIGERFVNFEPGPSLITATFQEARGSMISHAQQPFLSLFKDSHLGNGNYLSRITNLAAWHYRLSEITRCSSAAILTSVVFYFPFPNQCWNHHPPSLFLSFYWSGEIAFWFLACWCHR